MSAPRDTDPVDEMVAVIGQTLAANALILTSSRGGYGYVGGQSGHPTLDSDAGAVEAVAGGLLARRVAEPSRSAAPRETAAPAGLDVELLSDQINEDAAYIAAASPVVVAALIRENRQQAERIAALERAAHFVSGELRGKDGRPFSVSLAADLDHVLRESRP